MLVAAIDVDPGHLNPAITTSGGVHTASEILYNGLVRLDDDGAPQPDLAEGWEVLDGGRRYRIFLRRDVRWHDGEAFDAEDVVFTFEELLLRFHSRTRASLGGLLQSVTALDAHTVEFVLTAPYGPLLQQLDVTEAPIIPAHLFRGSDPLTHPSNRSPVGTGPFRFVAYEPGAIRYAANDDFFGGKPRLDALVLRLIPDEGTAAIALEAGDVQWLFGVPGPARERLARSELVRFLETTNGSGGSNCVNTLVFNLERPLMGELRMRQALAHGVDREQIVDRVLFGAGIVAAAPISSGIPWAHAPDLPVPGHDRDRSRALLDSLGWLAGDRGLRASSGVPGVEDGTSLSIDFLHMPGFTEYGDILRAQLREVGVDLRPRSLEPAFFAEAVFVERDFDTAIVSYCNGPDPEVGVRRQYISSNIGPVPFSNGAAYRNATVDSLFDAARGAPDREERGRIYRQIQSVAVADLPYFWLTESVTTRAYSARCGGFSGDGHWARDAWCER